LLVVANRFVGMAEIMLHIIIWYALVRHVGEMIVVELLRRRGRYSHDDIVPLVSAAEEFAVDFLECCDCFGFDRTVGGCLCGG